MLWKSHENVIKNPGNHFSGPLIQIFHFHGVFFRPWIFYENLIMGQFMAHEIAMKYLALGFMSNETLVCYRLHGPSMKITLRDFRGPQKWEIIISISWVTNIPLNMCHVGPWDHMHWLHGPWKFLEISSLDRITPRNI